MTPLFETSILRDKICLFTLKKHSLTRGDIQDIVSHQNDFRKKHNLELILVDCSHSPTASKDTKAYTMSFSAFENLKAIAIYLPNKKDSYFLQLYSKLIALSTDIKVFSEKKQAQDWLLDQNRKNQSVPHQTHAKIAE